MTILSAQSIDERVMMSADSQWARFHGQEGLLKPEIVKFRRKHDLVIIPYVATAKQACGMSYGLSSCGYDIRVGTIDKHVKMDPRKLAVKGNMKPVEAYSLAPGGFLLCSSLEYVEIPHDLAIRVADKSTLARQGLAVQNTICEPGWRGYITLELTNHSSKAISIRVGQPIAQLLFETLDKPTILPYTGKYQDQPNEVVGPQFLSED